MSFPQTRLTLIQRLASGGREEDWARFLKDYWGPVCRFSLRWGARNLDDAEDVASETFAVLWESRLLVRWVSARSAKLRTLLCSVVRKILSNWNRVRASRDRFSRELAEHVEELESKRSEQADAFYAAWVEEMIQRAVESLATEYYRCSKGDYVRVLYGRLCQRLTIVEVAEALDITAARVDNYCRHAKKRLSEKLRELVLQQVQSYAPSEEVQEEFASEWQQLHRHLTEYGGLEEAIHRAYDLFDPVATKQCRGAGLTRAVTRLTAIIHSSDDVTRSGSAT